MRKEEAAKLRAEIEEYFSVHGWKWESVREFKRRNSYFYYGSMKLLKPSVRVER